jgi:hypothetical protein
MFNTQTVDGTSTSNLFQANTFSALVAPVLPMPTVPPPTLVDTVLALPGTFISTALNLITQALAPVFGPGAPADNPVLWGVLAFVRRQFNETFANSTPVLAPRQTSQDVDDSQVHGTFGGTDADGDPLTYTVPATGLGAPVHGTVAIDEATGTYTYTPTAGYVGEDYFFVTATDYTAGPHIHALGQTHAAAARVDVHVESSDVNPPSVPDPEHPYTPDPLQAGDPAGTVRGHIAASDPQGLPITYTGSLSNAQGSVIVDPNGNFVYAPTDAARHAAAADDAASSGADTFMFTVIATNSAGASSAIPVSVPISPTLNQAPTAPQTQPPATTNTTDGEVASSIGYTDADRDPLTYTGPVGGHTAGGGTVVVNPDSSYTYTPTTQQRLDAYSTAGNDTDSFSITISDGHGGVLDVPVSVTIDPVGAAVRQSTVSPPLPGNQQRMFGTDGTVALITRFGTGTTDDPHNTAITVIHPNGTTTTTTAAGRLQSGGALVSADGTTYMTTYVGTGTQDDPYRDTTVTVIQGGGTATAIALSGVPSDRLGAGPDNGAYQTTCTGTGSDSDPYRTALTLIHRDGTTVTGTAAGSPYLRQIGSDGTAAQAIIQTIETPAHVALIVIHPDGTITTTAPVITTASASYVLSPAVGADGTTALALITGTSDDPYSTTLTIVHPNGSTTITTVVGVPLTVYGTGPSSAAVAADGRVALTTIDLTDYGTSDLESRTTGISVVRPDGNVNTTVLQGLPIGGAGFGADGSVTQVVITGNNTSDHPYRYNFLSIRPDGAIVSSSVEFRQFADFKVGRDGTVALIGRTGSNSSDDPYLTTITVVHPDGGTASTIALGRSSSTVVGTDGTVAQSTYTGTGSAEDPSQTTLTVIHPDGTTTSAAGGEALRTDPVVLVDGTSYMITDVDNNTVLTVIRPNGTTTASTAGGTYAGAAAGADGTVYETTSGFSNAGTTTVTAIHPDGSVTTSTLTGAASGNVRLRADGLAYQTVVTGSGTPADPFGTTLIAIRPDGTTATVTLQGRAATGVSVSPNGTAYQTTFTGTGAADDPYVYTVSAISVAAQPAGSTI